MTEAARQDWSSPEWHLPQTRRPCDHPSGPPSPETCAVCRRYVSDRRYRDLYDGREKPAGPPRRRAAPWPLPPAPARDLLRCRHLGPPTGETRYVEEGMG